jgi:hypothetical protein
VRLDRRDIKQMGVAYRHSPSTEGTFIVSLDFIKVRMYPSSPVHHNKKIL